MNASTTPTSRNAALLRFVLAAALASTFAAAWATASPGAADLAVRGQSVSVTLPTVVVVAPRG